VRSSSATGRPATAVLSGIDTISAEAGDAPNAMPVTDTSTASPATHAARKITDLIPHLLIALLSAGTGLLVVFRPQKGVSPKFSLSVGNVWYRIR
jgi:hypothetical protein